MSLKKPQRYRGSTLTPTGWQKLQERIRELETKTGIKYTPQKISDSAQLLDPQGLHPATIRKILRYQGGVDTSSISLVFRVLELKLDEGDYTHVPLLQSSPRQRHDLREVVDVSVFYGRAEELALLEQWIVDERCQLVAVLGMGGIGKTALTAKLLEQIKHNFELVIWRSLLHAPPVEDVLADLIQFLSNQPETDLPENTGARISQLIDYLQAYRCLVVLDNAETILRTGESLRDSFASRAGHYLEGYEGYGELLKRVGELRHQSCLMLTSREKPKEFVALEGQKVRSIQLYGLKDTEGREILKQKSLFSELEVEWRLLVSHYAGNPLALKIVSTTIQNVFEGSISVFLQQSAIVFGGISELLEQQFNRLSDLEKDIMYWLAVNREPISLSQLREDIVLPVPPTKLLEALESLLSRSLIEKATALVVLQPVVMEYVNERLIEQVCEEIFTQNLVVFKSHPLLKAQAKEYIKNAQTRLIIQPVAKRLLTIYSSKKSLDRNFKQILSIARENHLLDPGYIGGNILNLLNQLQIDVTGYDFSYLCVWQADLCRTNLYQVNFQNADLARSAFAESFSSILSVAISPCGNFFATGHTNGEIRLWDVKDSKQLLIFKGHTGWVRAVTFSPNGTTLASGSSDSSVRLWDVCDGKCLKILHGDMDRVRAVAFSPNGSTLASASDDRALRLWDVRDGKCLKILQGHSDRVRAIAFSPNGYMLASASDDRTLRLWDVRDGKCLKILQRRGDRMWTVAFNPQGTTLACGGEDKTVRLWDISTGRCSRIMQGHRDWVLAVAFNSQGTMLASGSHDQTIKLWDVKTGQARRILQGHTGQVWSIAFTPDGKTLVSGGEDQTVRIWDVSTGQILKTLSGYSNEVWSVAFNPQGTTLASGSNDKVLRYWDINTGEVLRTIHVQSDAIWTVAFCPDGKMFAASGGADKTIKLWDVSTGHCLKALQGHTDWIGSVTFSPQGKIIASGGADRAVRLWDVSDGKCLRILQGHNNIVRAVAFSPDGQILVSGSKDQTIKLWDVRTGQCLRILQGHTQPVSSVTFSPQDITLASGSDDRTVRLWDIRDGKCSKTLQGHTDRIQSVAFSADGQFLCSGSNDQTVKLWDVKTGQVLRTLQGHTGWVWSVAFSPNNRTLVSASQDGTVKIWDFKTGECLKTLRSARPYEGMNIKGVTGITEATKGTLKALGAAEL